DVDVREHSPAGGRYAGHQVGGALEQDDPHAGGGERPVDERDLAANRIGLRLRQRPRRFEMGARRGMHLGKQPKLVKGEGHSGQEVGTPRLADECFPLRKAEMQQRRDVAQRENDRVSMAGAHALRARSSNTAIASSSAPYSNSKQALPVTTCASSSKPRRPWTS